MPIIGGVETFRENCPEGTQPQISVRSSYNCEEIVKKDPTVKNWPKDVGSYAQFSSLARN